MKIKIKVNKSKSKNNLSTAGNCHSKQKKALKKKYIVPVYDICRLQTKYC